MNAATHGDGLRLRISGSDFGIMRAVVAGAGLPGVAVLAAAATNGPGSGLLKASTAGLSWRAPGSATFGAAQQISADGSYLLEDGVDLSKWIRIQVSKAYLVKSGQAAVYISDAYNAFGLVDVTAAVAASGGGQIITFTLANVSPGIITNVKLWIDASVSNLSVSNDGGVNYYTPTSATDPNVLTWSSIAAGASVSLKVKRTTAAAAASNPKVLNWIHYSWKGF